MIYRLLVSSLSFVLILFGGNALAQDLRSMTGDEAQENFAAFLRIAEFCSNEGGCEDAVRLAQIEIDGELIEGVAVNLGGDQRVLFEDPGQVSSDKFHLCWYNNYVEMYSVTCHVY